MKYRVGYSIDLKEVQLFFVREIETINKEVAVAATESEVREIWNKPVNVKIEFAYKDEECTGRIYHELVIGNIKDGND